MVVIAMTKTTPLVVMNRGPPPKFMGVAAAGVVRRPRVRRRRQRPSPFRVVARSVGIGAMRRTLPPVRWGHEIRGNLQLMLPMVVAIVVFGKLLVRKLRKFVAARCRRRRKVLLRVAAAHQCTPLNTTPIIVASKMRTSAASFSTETARQEVKISRATDADADALPRLQ